MAETLVAFSKHGNVLQLNNPSPIPTTNSVAASEVMNGVLGQNTDKNKNKMTKEDDVGKLFVGGLSYDTTKDGLKEYFSKFGEVVGVDIKMDALTGRSRGFAFVQFKEATFAEAVLEKGPHVLDGRTIDPKPACPINKPPHLRVKKIFVGGLKPDTTDQQIREYFASRYAPVTEIEYVTEHSTKKRRGFCFVSFDSEDTVDKICEQQFHQIDDNKQVEVKRALPKELQQQQAALRAVASRAALIPPVGPFGIVARTRPLGAAAAARGTFRTPTAGAVGALAASGAYGPSYTALYGAAFPQVYEPTTYSAAPPGVASAYAAYGGGYGAAAAYAAGYPAYEYGAYGAAAREVRYPELHTSFGPIPVYTRRAAAVYHPYAR